MGRARKTASRHPFRENLEIGVFAVVAAMALKVFAVEAYQIPTGSMQPTLMGTPLLDPVTRQTSGAIHDRVLVDKVSYWFRDPERWEVVVFRYPLLTHVNYVKRLVGLGGEQLLIDDGDLWARPLGSDQDFSILRKPWKVQTHVWKRVWPPPHTAPATWLGWSEAGDVSRGEDGSLRFSGTGRTLYDHRIKDQPNHGYPDAIADRVPTRNARAQYVVGDLRARFRVTPEAGDGEFQALLTFGGLDFTLTLHPDGAVTLTQPELGLEREGRLSGDEAFDLDFSWWDHRLRLAADRGGDGLLWQEDFVLESRQPTRTALDFRSRGGRWTLEPPTVWRDVYYLPPRQSGAPPVFDVPEGHYFMMGDNTQGSLDSRDWQAETLTFEPAADDGTERVRGDHMAHGADPTYDNPRWNREGSVMTFRDEHGGIHQYSITEMQRSTDRLEPAPFVPREYVIGRAIAVFLPIPPFSPVWRFGLVH